MKVTPEMNATEIGDKEQDQSQNQYKTEKARQKWEERKSLSGRQSVLRRE